MGDAPIKRCFVVMPIGDPDSDDGAHFKGVYRTIRQSIEAFGYIVTRADDIKHDGAIGRDIVLEIANADLVVGDLTDGNPNVFYEVGVRHALRRHGTLLLQDSVRSGSIPFDLSAYRVIKYEGTVPGLGRLADSLGDAVRSLVSAEGTPTGGNPVHDWLPTLPIDVLSSASGDMELAMRDELRSLREELDNYQRRYGREVTNAAVGADPTTLLSRAEALLQRAKKGLVGPLIVQRARAMAFDRDVEGFLQLAVDTFSERVRIEGAEALDLSQMAGLLGLDELATAWLDYALNYSPGEKGLVQARMARLSHSELAEERELARRSIVDYLGLDLETMEFTKSKENVQAALLSFGFYVDAARRDDLHEETLVLLERLAERHPSSARPKFLLARTLGDLGRYEEAFAVNIAALNQADVYDTGSTWFGNDLHNHGYHVPAAEAYCVSWWLDIADPINPIHIADELSFALHEPWALRSEPVFGDLVDFRPVPDGIDTDTVIRLVRTASGMDGLGIEHRARIERAMERCGLTQDEVGPGERTTPQDRRRLCGVLYEKLRSDLTAGVTDRARPFSDPAAVTVRRVGQAAAADGAAP